VGFDFDTDFDGELSGLRGGGSLSLSLSFPDLRGGVLKFCLHWDWDGAGWRRLRAAHQTGIPSV